MPFNAKWQKMWNVIDLINTSHCFLLILFMIFKIKILVKSEKLHPCQIMSKYLSNYGIFWEVRQQMRLTETRCLMHFTLTIVSTETSLHTTGTLYDCIGNEMSAAPEPASLFAPSGVKTFAIIYAFVLISLAFFLLLDQRREGSVSSRLPLFSSGWNLSCFLLWTTASKTTWLHIQWCKRVSIRRSQVRRMFSNVSNS